MIDEGILRGLIAVVSLATFAGICWWAYRPESRARFEQDALLVFDEDERRLARGRSRGERDIDMSTGWSLYVIVLIVVNVLGCGWLLFANRSVQIDPREKGKSTGHDFDGIEELNNPLPAWWTWLFIATIFFSAGYLVLYPGFGSFPGVLGWTSSNQHERELAEASARFGPLFARYFSTPIPDLVEEPQAVAMGGRIFANQCAACHGSDARGNRGYPDLSDGDWIHGGAAGERRPHDHERPQRRHAGALRRDRRRCRRRGRHELHVLALRA